MTYSIQAQEHDSTQTHTQHISPSVGPTSAAAAASWPTILLPRTVLPSVGPHQCAVGWALEVVGGETIILLHPPLILAGASTETMRECQQNRAWDQPARRGVVRRSASWCRQSATSMPSQSPSASSRRLAQRRGRGQPRGPECDQRVVHMITQWVRGGCDRARAAGARSLAVGPSSDGSTRGPDLTRLSTQCQNSSVWDHD